MFVTYPSNTIFVCRFFFFFSEAGFPNDIHTYGLLSGIWSSSFALGAFLGPSIAGILYDLVGFERGTYCEISIHILLVSKTIFYFFKLDLLLLFFKRIFIINLRPAGRHGNNMSRNNSRKKKYKYKYVYIFLFPSRSYNLNVILFLFLFFFLYSTFKTLNICI